MKLKAFFLAAILCAAPFCASVHAEHYLLINFTSYTSPEADKAMEYAKTEQKKGRPVIIFLHEASVIVAAKSNAQQFQKQQKDLAELIKKGATVAACPHCLKQYKIDEADLMNGITIAQVSQE